MNNRERQWHEGKYGEHPATCNCYACREAKQLKEQMDSELAKEQARMRVGAEERAKALRERGQQKDLPKIDWSWLK